MNIETQHQTFRLQNDREWRAKLDHLKRQSKQNRHDASMALEKWTEWQIRAEASEAHCAKLDDFGKRFANHQDSCAVLDASPLSFSDTICNCGYDDALAALKDAP